MWTKLDQDRGEATCFSVDHIKRPRVGKRIYVESTHVTEILIKHLDIDNQQPKIIVGDIMGVVVQVWLS